MNLEELILRYENLLIRHKKNFDNLIVKAQNYENDAEIKQALCKVIHDEYTTIYVLTAVVNDLLMVEK